MTATPQGVIFNAVLFRNITDEVRKHGNRVQRRKRVVGRIRQDLLESLADDLTALAEAGEFPEQWLGPRNSTGFSTTAAIG